MKYTRELIEDSLKNRKYDEIMATFMLLGSSFEVFHKLLKKKILLCLLKEYFASNVTMKEKFTANNLDNKAHYLQCIAIAFLY